MSAHETHNDLTQEWILKVIGQTKTDTEAMVIVESALLGAMLLLVKKHGTKPKTAVAFVEAAVQQAIVRFTQETGA